ncbi:rhomboid family intramembrane serine protease [Sphingomonas sp.]|uniref:rhomboid family intramembrane serine protease n=1 Tax=Sphingomonas sp. TaxID=28214 RepID=UPI00286E311C|nr:rhomboid family intramembrane serine protease [Sphingomonas sp.]
MTALAWLLVSLIGAQDQAAMTMGFLPARFSGDLALSPAVPALLTPLSATLVHGGLLHLALNLLMLVWCGSLVERILGRGGLLMLYGVGAFAAAIAQWAVDPGSMTPMIGASGAISAVIGAFALSFGQQKAIVRSPALNRLLNTAWLLAARIVLQLMTGWLAGGQGLLLATPAHIGGFLAGLALQRPLLLWRYRGA